MDTVSISPETKLFSNIEDMRVENRVTYSKYDRDFLAVKIMVKAVSLAKVLFVYEGHHLPVFTIAAEP